METKIPLAFVAGLLSFVTPCVLPLVPGYLSAVSGVQIGVGGRKVVAASIPFIAGFTLVFVALGALAGAAGGLVHDQRLLSMVAGVIVVVFGFAFMGLLPFPWLDRMVAPELVEGARRRGSRALLGGAFGVCAAPCIGPVLATILALAGDASTAAQGSLLLLVYSLGLAVPFVLVGIGFDRAMGASRWLRDRYDAVRFVSGALLVALGLLLFFDRFWWIRIAFNRLFEKVRRGRLVQAVAEPAAGEPDRLGPRLGSAHDRAPLHLVEPRVHPVLCVGLDGEFVPARGGEGDRHVHLPEPNGVGDPLHPFALEPEGHFFREAGGRRHARQS